MSPSPDEYAPPSALAERFNVSTRSIERWGKSSEVRTIDNPLRRGKLYHVADVERLAAAVQTAQKVEQPATEAPGTEIVPQSDLLRMLDDTQRRLEAAMHEAGRLRGQLDAQQKLLESAQDSEQLRLAAEAERDRLRHAIERLPRWIRLLWLRR